jgi:hypothetical protein
MIYDFVFYVFFVVFVIQVLERQAKREMPLSIRLSIGLLPLFYWLNSLNMSSVHLDFSELFWDFSMKDRDLKLSPSRSFAGFWVSIMMVMPFLGFFLIVVLPLEAEPSQDFEICLIFIIVPLACLSFFLFVLEKEAFLMVFRLHGENELIGRLIFRLDKTGAICLFLGLFLSAWIVLYFFITGENHPHRKEVNALILLAVFFGVQLVLSDNLLQSIVLLQAFSFSTQSVSLYWLNEEELEIRVREFEMGAFVGMIICRLKFRCLDFESLTAIVSQVHVDSVFGITNTTLKLVFFCFCLDFLLLIIQIMWLSWLQRKGSIEPAVMALATAHLITKVTFFVEGLEFWRHFWFW